MFEIANRFFWGRSLFPGYCIFFYLDGGLWGFGTHSKYGHMDHVPRLRVVVFPSDVV